MRSQSPDPETWTELAKVYQQAGYEVFVLPWIQFAHHEVRVRLEETFARLNVCGEQESEELPVYCMKAGGHELLEGEGSEHGWAGLDLADELATLHQEKADVGEVLGLSVVDL